mmetsp:Transcript_72366/g.109175  ORF Transcript_72366/g.109175 Transcript_72366/m.109175 type:complete len:88 (-) Transcript_72366:402-665(-)
MGVLSAKGIPGGMRPFPHFLPSIIIMECAASPMKLALFLPRLHALSLFLSLKTRALQARSMVPFLLPALDLPTLLLFMIIIIITIIL